MFKRFLDFMLLILGFKRQEPVLDVPAKPVVNDPAANHPIPDGDINYTIGVVVGHTKEDGGAEMAAPYKMQEYQYNTKVAEAMVKAAKAKGLSIHVIFRDGIGIDGAYKQAFDLKCDVVIELHFNAFNTKCHGSLVYCSPDNEDVTLAWIMQDIMEKVFKRDIIKDRENGRTVTPLGRFDRGGRSVFSYPGMANCLVEPFFGDNAAEAKMGVEKLEEYAEALVNGCIIYGKKKGVI